MKYLIVDDEPLARERMVRLLESLAAEAQTREAANGAAALAVLDEFMPDIVLLDIRMPGMDGIAVAAALAELPEPPAIIFCTAYDQYALQALDHQAVAYLLKPVRAEDLARALSRAGRVNKVQLARLSQPDQEDPTTLLSQRGSELEAVNLADVRCFVATEKLVIAHTGRTEHVIAKSLKELEHSLADQFVRVHRNALAARSHVRALRRDSTGGWVVELDGCDLSPAVSRRHYSVVKQCLLDRQGVS